MAPRRSARLVEKIDAGLSKDTIQPKPETTQPFRFFDLPPELRNRIYSFTFPSYELRTHELGTFKLPTMTRASRQLRQESLSLFLSECNFTVLVGCNFAEAAERIRNPEGRLDIERPCHAGTVGVKHVVRDVLKAAGEAVVFRHVKFGVFDSDDIEWVRECNRVGRSNSTPHTAVLILNYANGKLQHTSEDGPSHPRSILAQSGRYFMRPPQTSDIDAILAITSQIAHDIADRDGFNGFSLKDLKKIARGFRFE